jgi:GTP pyrophosphokinase
MPMSPLLAASSVELGEPCASWLDRLGEFNSSQHEVLGRACRVAERAHHGQTRASGDPYIAHPLAVADILRQFNMDHETLAAAILHDVVEDTSVTLDQIKAQFGPSIAALVDGVTKMDVIDELSPKLPP